MIVRSWHLRLVEGFGPKPGFCVPGARLWFAAHALDWRAFCRQGIEADILSATGDPMALALVATARAVIVGAAVSAANPDCGGRGATAMDGGNPGNAGCNCHG